jgi:hypothetical protein
MATPRRKTISKNTRGSSRDGADHPDPRFDRRFVRRPAPSVPTGWYCAAWRPTRIDRSARAASSNAPAVTLSVLGARAGMVSTNSPARVVRDCQVAP